MLIVGRRLSGLVTSACDMRRIGNAYHLGVGSAFNRIVFSLCCALAIGAQTTLFAAFSPGTPPPPSVAEAMRTFIDNPASPSSPFVGLATFSGWAIDDISAIMAITVSVDGAPVGTAAYGGNRPDVCTAYPNQVGCPNVGWSFQLDTTRIPSGIHTLEVTATSATGGHRTVNCSFSVANWTANNPTLIFVDVPNANAPYMGVVTFGGWAINAQSPISAVEISVDGAPLPPSAYGGNRPDVCAVFQNALGCPNVGWTASVDTTKFADGAHILAVTARPVSGASTTVTVSFAVMNNTPANPTKVWIDAPSSPNEALTGTVQIAGWAFSRNDPATVTIYVDGIGVSGTPSVSARPDVCAVYSNPTGCPNVGWSYVLDTTKLANGSHILQVVAQLDGSEGANATAAIPFSVVNSTSDNPTTIFIDVPGGQTSIMSGTLVAAGWAVNDNNPISQVTVYVDGLSFGVINYGLSRPDVCNVYLGRPGCPNVGWHVEIDTTQLANGAHRFTAIASTADGESAVASSTFKVDNWTGSGNPVTVNIDTPGSSSAALAGPSVMLGGWAIDSQALIAAVIIGIDGVPFGSANYGVNRLDVCAVYPNQPNCPYVGWNYPLNTTLLADGTHTLDVTVLTVDGQNYTTSSSFSVANLTGSNPIRMIIDVPNAASTSFGGMAAFAGWAIDDNAPIGSVNVYVDGLLAGAASYGGVRTDVCNVFPARPGCPDVGWSFLLDTTAYADGAHMLQVTALAADGQAETRNTPFAISNPLRQQLTQHMVSLTWMPSTSPGVLGYNVYRGTSSGGPYTNIAGLVAGTEYVDNTVSSGQTYYYVTTAVASDNVESVYSNEAVAVIPSP